MPGARALGLTVEDFNLFSSFNLDDVFKVVRVFQPDGLITLDGPFPTINRGRIMQLAAELGIPAIYPQRIFADDGGLMSYGPNYTEMFRRLAELAAPQETTTMSPV